jgi:DNA-binding IclR family transcriptional regulator
MATGMEEPDNKGSRGIKSVEVGHRVLLAVQRGPGAVQLSEVAKRSNLSSGAAHNYLASLLRTGLIEQEGRGLYRLGPSAFALSLASFQQLNGYDVMRNEALTVHQKTGHSTAVSVWSQGGPVSIYIQRSDQIGSLEFRSGQLPMLGSAAGLLMTAYLPDQLTLELVKHELAASGRSERTPKQIIAASRKEVLPKGYARFQHKQPGHFPLSAPIWTADDRIAFVLSVVVNQVTKAKTEAAWTQSLLARAERAELLLAGTLTTRCVE